MLERLLVLLIFAALFIATGLHGDKPLLIFFTLFPSLIFPIIYFYLNSTKRPFFWITGLCTASLFGFYLLRVQHIEILILGTCLCLFLLLLYQYHRFWIRSLKTEEEACLKMHQELEMLKAKHDSRQDSLQHLERQVIGLLNLFEIARDFGDVLSFDTMASLLSQNVLPQLPAEKMLLVEMDAHGESPEYILHAVSKQGVEKREQTSEAEEIIGRIGQTEKVQRTETRWLFPLSLDPKFKCVLEVQKANPDDLAKFEVLGAYLTLQAKKIRLYETVRELSIRDGLTGVFVRRHFVERFEDELKRALKHELPVAVLMLDIDHFKRYNDEHGHLAGDATLKQVARLLIDNLRKVDIVARYGGEEFIVVMPETSQKGAMEVAERIRSSIARHLFRIYNEESRVTVSVGVSLFPEHTADFLKASDISKTSPETKKLSFELIRFADKALYQAKEEGRNRVIPYKHAS